MPVDAFIRNEEERELVEWAGALADELALDAKAYDESGEFVYEQMAMLHHSGYSAITVPKEYGGRGVGLYAMLLAQERLAKGDASTALVIGWHLGITLSLRSTQAWPEPIYRSFCEQVIKSGALVNACGTEPETGSPSRGGKPTTTARAADGGYVIAGRKTWATGSPVLTHILVTAYAEAEDRVGEFLVRSDSPGLRIEESWNSMSMRGTGSDTVILEDVFVPQEHALDFVAAGQKTKRSSDGSGWMLHIPATYLGIAGAARDYVLDFARAYAPNSLGKPIATVPHVREKIGRIEATLTTARTLLYETARRYEETPLAQRPRMRIDLALAKHVATNAAVDVVDLAMRVAGGHSLMRSAPLERYYRDVRAGLHNPPMDDITLYNLADRALAEVEP